MDFDGPGEKILEIPLIVDKLMSQLDLDDLKNCRLTQKSFLENRASFAILARNLCKPITFFYDQGNNETFVLKKCPAPGNQGKGKNKQVTLDHLLACFEQALLNNHNFPCVSYHFETVVDISTVSGQLSNLLAIVGSSIRSLTLHLQIRSEEDYSNFRQILQYQCPNVDQLILGHVDDHWDQTKLIPSPCTDFAFDLPNLKYFSPELAILQRNQGPFSIVAAILRSTPNLMVVEPFYLKFTQMFFDTGKLDCVQECCYHVDGGAATCWESDPASDGYESYHGNFDTDFENFVSHSDKIKLKRFRIWVSHWAFVDKELNESAHLQWNKEVTLTLLECQRHFLTELGDIPLSLLLRVGDKIPEFPNVKFLSIRQLPLAPETFENYTSSVSFDFCLQKKFPKLKSVRFIQMQSNLNDEDLEGEENYKNFDLTNYQLGSVHDLEIRHGCRGDSGSGIRDKELVTSLFPCIKKLTMHQTDDLGVTLKDIFETFGQLEELIFDGVFIHDDFINLDPILTGFSDQVCQQIWTNDDNENGANFVMFKDLRTAPSLLCLTKLKLFKLDNLRRHINDDDETAERRRPDPFSHLSVKYAFKLMPNLRLVVINVRNEDLLTTFDSISSDVEIQCRPKILSSEQEFWKET